MYTARVVVYGKDGVVNDLRDVRTGFRVSKLVMHDGAWDHPDKMPKGRSDSPALMWINGREIFCKGSNWIPPDIFYGTVGEDKYRKLLTLAKDANFNMIRVWGGGNVNKDVFYDICDELGLMVWQEFPLACNNYPDEDAYLKVLDAESVSIIKRIKKHPCLVLWCGGNELFNKWSGMTEQSFALRILNRNCYELDRFTPFISTSPLDGMAHGSYVFYDMETGEDIIELINRSDNTAYPEFACPSLAREEILAEIIPENERDSYFESDSWVSHHAFDAFTPTAWAMPEVIEHYFGKSDSLSLMIEHSRLLQAEGLKAIYEEARRKQPKTSMALNWCLDESWPVAAGTSIIDWKLEPKPAYYSVKQSLRTVLLSLRFKKFMWSPDENIEAEVWLINDSSEDIDPGEIRVSIGQIGTVLLYRSLAERSGKKLPAVRIGTIGIGAGEFGEGIVLVKVTSDKHPEINSEYKVMIASVKIPKKMRKSKANLNE